MSTLFVKTYPSFSDFIKLKSIMSTLINIFINYKSLFSDLWGDPYPAGRCKYDYKLTCGVLVSPQV
jgi:hypothetical protein